MFPDWHILFQELKDFFFSLKGTNFYQAEVLTLASLICTTMVFGINHCIFKIRDRYIIDFGLKPPRTIIFFWIIGGTSVTFLLFFLQVISYKITAVILVSFVWEKFFERVYKGASDSAENLDALKNLPVN